jgi:hypothetical protein
VVGAGLERRRRLDLEFVHLLVPAFAERRWLSLLAFIVYDENSRNASDMSGDPRRSRDPPGAAIRAVAAR